VRPRWQGRGVGKALLATVEAESTKSGVRIIGADVSVTAKEFFGSRGFRITEAKSNVILGHPAPNFRMQKALNSEPADAAANGSQSICPETNGTSSTSGSPPRRLCSPNHNPSCSEE
jgi:predicted N-acetyltransferase YhbS